MITGGAKGIGKATAKVLAKNGARVAITDIDEKQGKETAQELSSEGTVKFYKLDVTKEEEWEKTLQSIQDDLGTIDILHNNAGIYIISPIAETSIEDYEKLMSINVKGVFWA